MSIPAHLSAEPAMAPAPVPLVRLLPLCGIVFLCFSTIGVPLPVLPAQVHDVLGFDAVLVALIIGVQSLATLATRHTAGSLTDRRGPSLAVTMGMVISSLAGLVYLASLPFEATPRASLALLFLGRLILGVGESLAITGVLSWGVALVGKERAGRVMAWVGIAMYGAIAVGAPVGAALGKAYGFAGVALVAAVAPLAALTLLAAVPSVKPAGGARVPFTRVIGVIWRQGLGLTLASLGFGALAAFGPLYWRSHGWAGSAAALSAFGAAYIVARLVGGTFPDRFGGIRVASISLCIEIAGQLLLWSATTPALAVLGSALTGLGFSLVFPSLGVEAVRRTPPSSRGVALGGYVAFFDLAIGVLVPLSGGLVHTLGYDFAFLAGAITAALSLALTLASSRASVQG